MDQQGSDQNEYSEAVAALNQYLSDSIAPMIFAESADDLFDLPLRNTASSIFAWVSAQSQVGGAVSTSDYIYHAVKKLHLLGELELVPRDRVSTFIKGLNHFLVQGCPELERQTLSNNLDNLAQSRGTVEAKVTFSAQSPGAQTVAGAPAAGSARTGVAPQPAITSPPGAVPQPGAAAPTAVVGANILQDRRVGLMLQHLQSALSVAPHSASGPLTQAPLMAAILAEATAMASDPKELQSSLGQLQKQGVPVLDEGIIKLLSQSLPDWAAPAVEEEHESPQRAVRAMKQVIALASDRQEKYKRFDELVGTAVEEFNNGSLGKSVTMLDLAGRMIDEEEVDASIIEAVHKKGYAALDEMQLRQCAESEDLHYLFRRVMSFFPQMSPQNLFGELEMEQSRDRRRLLLQLLTAQGEETRSAALESLQSSIRGEISLPWFLERNLVYLLRTIERPEEQPVGPEIDVLIQMSEPFKALPLIREATATLGQMKEERVVKTLIARVSELEDALLGARELPHSEEELQSLLDTSLTMLARIGTPEARRCVVVHGLKRDPKLGDTTSRLAKLSSQDLSEDANIVKRLVNAIKEELPTKVFGMSVGGRRKAENVEHMITALSSTDNPLVRKAFAELGERYKGQPLAEAATRALQNLGSQPPEPGSQTAALAGDLGLFGLPSLLQNLSDTQVTGVLTVLDANGNTAAAIRLENGLILNAKTGNLQGETAVYQMLERPIQGRFIFVDNEDESIINMEKGDPKAVQPVLFEGIRRYDEFMRAVTLAPDDAQFKPTGQKPTRVPDEADAEMLKAVWFQAAKGATPAECEQEFAVDCYRVRRLFEHWIGEGSLAPVG